jgi:DNA-binding GntR family transcriptional regulator
MRLDPGDARPAYLQVADHLRQAITSGAYAPGSKLPSGRTLAREYGIAPMTASSALKVLRDEGLIGSLQGRSFYVLGEVQRPSRAAASSRRLDRIDAEVADLRRQVTELTEQIRELQEHAGRPRVDPHPAASRRSGRAGSS